MKDQKYIVNIEELRLMVDYLVEQKLIELFGDPEDDLEFNDEFKAKLSQMTVWSDDRTQSFESVVRKLGIK